MLLRQVLHDFDRYLAARGHSFEALVVGRGALELAAVETKARPEIAHAVEVIYPFISTPISKMAEHFAQDYALSTVWLRESGLGDITRSPDGWTRRMHLTTFAGQAIFLHSLAREDIIALSLLAVIEGRATPEGVLALGLGPEEIEASRSYLVERTLDGSMEDEGMARDHVDHRLTLLGDALRLAA
ncbi:MAG: hypothetical protein KAI47_07915 [Deltaproteobacteria bacterium]|nr:hypothetical protein [Deltaproteobacteria bacterium]